jgi:hypothetical protein
MTITLINAGTKAEIPVTFVRTAGSTGDLDPADVKAYRSKDGQPIGGFLKVGTIAYPDPDTAIAPVLIEIPDDEPGGTQVIRTRMITPTWASIELGIYILERSAPPPE